MIDPEALGGHAAERGPDKMAFVDLMGIHQRQDVGAKFGEAIFAGAGCTFAVAPGVVTEDAIISGKGLDLVIPNSMIAGERMTEHQPRPIVCPFNLAKEVLAVDRHFHGDVPVPTESDKLINDHDH